jgi:uncharacterized membrane protein YdjX (TVP38/TMEM64 family)
MTASPPHDPERDDEPRDGKPRVAPLARIERAIEHDVAEARAIEPLVAGAHVVHASFRDKIKRAIPLLVLASLAIAFIASGLYKELNITALARHHDTLTVWVAAHPVSAALAFVGLLALVISTGLPGGAVLLVGAGLIFGMWQATVLAIVGDTLGACALYFAARQFFMHDGARPPAMVERIRAGFQSSPVSFAFFIRLVPVFPFGACSVALAWLGCRFPLFITATALGVIPSSLVYAALGQGLGKTIDARQPISIDVLAQPQFFLPLLALAVLALVPALFGLRRRKPVAADPPIR